MQGLYLHYPYCRQPAPHWEKPYNTDRSLEKSLLDCLNREMTIRADTLPSKRLDSIYIGGGTPSLLAVSDLENLFQQISQHFQVAEGLEVTMELSPKDISDTSLKSISQKTPVNRVSLGIQSFSQQDLDLLNCPHTVEDNHRALQLLDNSSINNVNIDLLHGLPGQTLKDWESTLHTTFEYDFQHLMRDRFSLADKPSLQRQITQQEITLPPEDTVRPQFAQLRQMCQEMRWEQYELNNFCQPGCYSRQNIIYWFDHAYLGIGPGAHSYFPGHDPPLRQWNTKSIKGYTKAIRKKEFPVEGEHLTPADQCNEFVMHRLSTRWGLDLSKVKERFGDEYARLLHPTLESHREDGRLQFEEGTWTFTPEGQFEADQILTTLFIDH